MKFQRLHCVSQIGGHGFQKVIFCETFGVEIGMDWAIYYHCGLPKPDHSCLGIFLVKVSPGNLFLTWVNWLVTSLQ
jgi:hypothetical protein